jgi:hypothetical protein
LRALCLFQFTFQLLDSFLQLVTFTLKLDDLIECVNEGLAECFRAIAFDTLDHLVESVTDTLGFPVDNRTGLLDCSECSSSRVRVCHGAFHLSPSMGL